MFSERLRMLRKEKGLTQVQAAQAVHMSNRGYQDLELGRKPTYENLLAIANFYDVSADWLMGRTEDRTLHR
jgi:transcriptional regulator with XRE-family HTH domain